MAGQGREVGFHGAFKTKAKATAKEHQVPGSYIERTTIKGQVRYLVLTRAGHASPVRGSTQGESLHQKRKRRGGFRLPNIF
jgi:hypothetical protein